MPQQVIDRIVRYRTWEHANIHRGVHYLSETATAAYEHARSIARGFLNAGEDREVIFTSNCTDGINLVAHGYGRKFIGAGDEIILTHLEHHANIVPWQMLCEEKGARLRIVPVTDAGELVLEEYERLFNPRTKFVAVDARLERARHDQPGQGDDRDRPPARRAGAGGRRAGRAPPEARRPRPRLRLLRDHRPQDLRADRHRRALRQGEAARGDAALQGRRRHDPVGHVREDHLQPHPAQVRGRHAADRRGDRTRRGDGVHDRGRPRGNRRARALRSSSTRPSCSGPSPACGSSGRRRTRRRCSPSTSATFTRTTSARS